MRVQAHCWRTVRIMMKWVMKQSWGWQPESWQVWLSWRSWHTLQSVTLSSSGMYDSSWNDNYIKNDLIYAWVFWWRLDRFLKESICMWDTWQWESENCMTSNQWRSWCVIRSKKWQVYLYDNALYSWPMISRIWRPRYKVDKYDLLTLAVIFLTVFEWAWQRDCDTYSKISVKLQVI